MIGLIFAGLLIGPSGARIVGESEVLFLFAEIGAILLLFYIGIEFDFQKLIRVAVKSVFFATVKLLLVFVTIYEILLLFNVDSLSALLVAFMFSFTSTAIMIRILEQKGLTSRKELPVLVTALIVEDIVAVIGITMVSSLDHAGGSVSESIIAVATAILLLIFAYVVLSRILERVSRFFEFEQNEELLLFFSLTLCLALSMAAFYLGLSPAIGAFLAGSLISSLRIGHLAGKATSALGLAFAAFFFISIGLSVHLESIMPHIGMVLVLIAAQIAAYVVFAFTAAKTIGFDSKAAAFSGLALAVSGEFSLLFAREATRFSSIDLLGIASLSVIATALFSSLLVTKSDSLLALLRQTPEEIRTSLRSFFRFTSRLTQSMEYAGKLHKMLLRVKVEHTNDLWKILGASAVLVGVYHFLPGVRIEIANRSVSLFVGVAVVLGLLILYSLFRLLQSVLSMLDAFADSVMRKADGSYRQFERELAIAIVLFSVGLSLPTLIDLLQLPGALKWLRTIPILFAILFGWNAIKNQNKSSETENVTP